MSIHPLLEPLPRMRQVTDVSRYLTRFLRLFPALWLLFGQDCPDFSEDC